MSSRCNHGLVSVVCLLRDMIYGHDVILTAPTMAHVIWVTCPPLFSMLVVWPCSCRLCVQRPVCVSLDRTF